MDDLKWSLVGKKRRLLMRDKIDHEYTRNIVCPYCGYEDEDSWECELGDEDCDVIECGRCEEDFDLTAEVSRTFTTKKIEEN